MSRIRQFFSQRSTSLSYFPVAHLLLVFITTAIIINIYSSYSTGNEIAKYILSAIVAFFLSILPGIYHWIKKDSSEITSTEILDNSISIEHRTLDRSSGFASSIIRQFIAVCMGIVFYYFLPKNIDVALYSTRVRIGGSILIAFLLILLTIARIKIKEEKLTWTWCKELFESILVGGLAGLIIRGGISACIKSIEYLFNIQFTPGKIYEYVATIALVLIGGSIALLNFTNQQNKIPEYTRLHRIFGQYIFLPLTIIYGLILISYGIKILITGIRPTGIIIYMVLGYIAFGMLTRLTTYPALPNRFMNKSHLVLFISFFLTSLLMIPAIQMRIQQYGLTIDRYFVCAIILWIMLFSIGGILFKNHRMMIIISLLILISGFSVYGGKWNASNLSETYQKNILLKNLQTNNIQTPLISGSLQSLPPETQNEIITPLIYITKNIDRPQLTSIIPFADTLQNADRYQKEYMICEYLGIKECGYRPSILSATEKYFNFYSKNRFESLSIDNYSTIYNFSCSGGKTTISLGQKVFDFAPYMNDIYSYAKGQQHQLDQKTPAQTDQMISSEDKQYDAGYVIKTDTMKIILYEIGGRQLQNKDNITYYDINYCNGIALVK